MITFDKNTGIYFDDRKHIYIDADSGRILPSVTQLVNFLFPKKYADVPEEVLQAAAARGTRIHELIEKAVTGQEYEASTPEEFNAVTDAESLLQIANIKVTATERILRRGMDYAGRYDLLAVQDEKAVLIDIKTTSKLDIDALHWQMGLYATSDNMAIDKCFALWVPKRGKAKLQEIEPATREEIAFLLMRYEDHIAGI